MSVVRVHKTKNFTIMSNTHFKEKKMSLKSKGLLSLMLSLPESWDYSIAGLVTLSKDGKDSVMSALAELEEFGYLTRTRKTDSKGRFSGVEYQIFEEPQPIADNPNSGEPNSVKTNEENPPQLNTELTKNLNINNTNELIPKELREVLNHSVVNEDIRKLYFDYVEMRHTMNMPLTKRGLEMLIARCDRLSNFNVRVQKLLLETAIINNWKNVYLPKEEEVKEANREVLDELKSFYFDDE